MELEKIRTLNEEELKAEQAKAGEQLFRLRFQQSLGNQRGHQEAARAEAGHRPHPDGCP